MRKKYITLVVIASLVLMTLSACTVNTAETAEPSTSVSPAETEASQDPVEVSASPSPSPSPSPVSWSVATPSPATSPAAMYPYRGIWIDGVYNNSFADIRFNLPEGWEVSTDEQLAYYTDTSPDIYSSRKIWNQEARNSNIMYDTMLTEMETHNTILIYYSKIHEYSADIDLFTQYRYEEKFEKAIIKKYQPDMTVDTDLDLNLVNFNKAVLVHDDAYDISSYFLFRCKKNYLIIAAVVIDDYTGKTINELVDEFQLTWHSVLVPDNLENAGEVLEEAFGTS